MSEESSGKALRARALALASLLCVASNAPAVPPVTPGFPNTQQTPGAILSGLNAPQQGRTAVIAYHNGVLFTVPEIPSSQPGADFQVRTWDIRDPTQPVVLTVEGTTPHPIAAHGYFKSGPYLVLGSNWPPGSEWSFLAGATPRTVQRTAFPQLTCAGARGCLFGPWYIDQTFWSYSEVSGDAAIYLDWNLLAEWDHLGLTGVIGHPFLLGDLLIFASDQSRTGVATYDVGDPGNPTLLDVLTTGGPGGYWPEIWGHDGSLYIVFPYRTGGNGFRVVDATDPANLRFVTDRPLPGDASMYIQFQDEYAFMGSHKVDMRTFESVLFLDGANTPRPNQPGEVGIDTSQHLLPLGNLLVTGGVGPNEGMAIWAHQAEPDTRGPSVGYHIPQAGRTSYPLRAPISLLIHETLETFTIVNGETFIARPVGGQALGGRITFSFDDVLTFAPDQPLLPDTSYEVIIPEDGIKDAAGNGIAGYSFTFSTGATIDGNAPPTIDSFTAGPYPAAPGSPVTLSAAASDGDDDPLEYRFDFGDGSAKTDWSASSSTTTSYLEPGHYRVSVQVRDPAGSLSSRTRAVTVAVPPTGPRPTNSSPISCDDAARIAWVVNPDNDSLAAVDMDTAVTQIEVPVCDDPRSVAISSTNEIWVACHDDDTVRVLDESGTPLVSAPTGHGTAPWGLSMSPAGDTVFVTLYGSGELVRFDAASRQQTGRIALAATAAAVAISGDGSRVYVTRFLSPANHAEVWEVDAAAMSLVRTIAVPKFGGEENFDSTAAGRGVANYLAGIAIAPDGQTAWVAANKPNTERGVLFGPDLDQDNTVRNVAVQLDLGSAAFERAIDIDNSDSARALAFSPLGDYLAVALQGNDEVVIFDTLSIASSNGLGSFVSRLGTGSAPQGVCSDAVSGRTFVKNLMSRDATVLETGELFRDGTVSVTSQTVSTVSNEQMAPATLHGKRIFYNASDPRMSSEGYLSCATCHVDGGHDGRIWDFTGRGEGLRNTTTLRGRAGTGHGNVHWSANFDEIQDFENDIRNAFGGTGFLSDEDFAETSDPLGNPKAGRSADLDSLASYVASLDSQTAARSPWRNSDGSMTAAALAGASHFAALGCDGCHAGAELTDSTLGTANLHDVGTIRTTSGGRLGGPLLGIDTPSLLGVWAGAPYFHDGSAATIDDVFRVAGGTTLQAEDGAVSGNAWITNQWVEFNNDDTVHGRALVDFGGPGGAFTFFNVDGGAGGLGAVEARYSSGYGVFTLEINVNGTTRSAPLPLVGNDPQWRHTNWARVRIEDLPFTAGTTNTVRVSTPSQWANISVDEILISGPGDLAAAQPHRIALSLSGAERSELRAYLLQIEGAVAPPSPTPPATPSPSAPPTPTHTPVTHSIGGEVRHAGSSAPLGGVAVDLDGPSPAGQTTSDDGQFVFGELEPSAWTITARREDASLTGVSALDAARALQSAIGSVALNPDQALACDVSGNGTVSALDAAYILQRLVGTMASFPVATSCSSDWIFVPRGDGAGAVGPAISNGICVAGHFTFDPLAGSIQGIRFDGAAFGDCTLNGGSAPSSAASAITSAWTDAPGVRAATREDAMGRGRRASVGADSSDEAESPHRTASVAIGPDRRDRRRYLRLPITLGGVDELSALDLTVDYDPQRLALRGARLAPGRRGVLMRAAETASGTTRLVLAGSRPIENDGRPIAYLIMERLRASESETLRGSATIDDLQAKVSAKPTRRHDDRPRRGAR